MDRKLPVGIQSFEKIRNDNFLYVDKTDYVYQLVHMNVPYFLSRPRRFGKSLFLSTLKAYFEGKKDLFQGLKIEKLEEQNHDAWKTYPIFYFDFNGVNYKEEGALEEALATCLRRWEQEYQIAESGKTLSERFQRLLMSARNQTKQRCVVLVDEYDKPLLDVIENKTLQEHNKEVFKGFFSVLKSFDEYIQFVFITGVSKFHKVSIFSDLNQLNDISLDEDFACICGITESELKENFSKEISVIAKRRGLEVEKCIELLKKQYDGYSFYPGADGVYNPYSLLKALFSKDFGAYWFETGTPSFLVKRLRNSNFDVRSLTDKSLYASEATLKDYAGDQLDPVPLLYQTGYLTIANYDDKKRRFELGFPNEEVKYGFLESLMPSYVPIATAGNKLDPLSITSKL